MSTTDLGAFRSNYKMFHNIGRHKYSDMFLLFKYTLRSHCEFIHLVDMHLFCYFENSRKLPTTCIFANNVVGSLLMVYIIAFMRNTNKRSSRVLQLSLVLVEFGAVPRWSE